MKNEFLDFADEEFAELTDEENTVFDFELVKANIANYTSQVLCDMIICYRYFKFKEDVALLCMEELAKRRLNGDIFEFENYIDSNIKELPVLDFSVPDFRTIFAHMLFNKK